MRWGFCFWNDYLRILKFWPLMVTSSTQKRIKKVQIDISCTFIDRKMNIKNKKYAEVKYPFIKLFSQYFEVLIQYGDVINPKLTRKRVQTRISCTYGGRKMKIKRKMNFQMRYSFMKLFSWNHEILTPCCDVTISKLGVKDSNLYIKYNWGLKN